MENKEINIAEILKDCPKGTKLYSPMYGSVNLQYVDFKKSRIHLSSGLIDIEFNEDGRYAAEGDCMLFPSKDQRDWGRFEKPVVPPFEIIPPKKGETFFFLNALLEVEKVADNEHIGLENDSIKMGFEIGNYFNTFEQAEYAAQKVKKLLLSLRKEAE